MPYIGVSPSNGVRRVHTYTVSGSSTDTFSGAGAEGTTLSYKDSNFVDVYQNGVKLADADYTATSGTSIVLGTTASDGDVVVIVVFDVFSVADTVSKADGGQFDGNVTMAGTLAVTGTTALTGNATMAGTLGVTGAVTANAGVVVDNITIDGTEIDLSSGDLTLDVAGNINLDADGGTISLQDAGTEVGKLILNSNGGDVILSSRVSDKDVVFSGNDGGSITEFMRIDSSEGGKIGIGTNSPSEKLEINTGTGNIGAKIVSTDSLALVAFKDNSTSDVVLAGASGDNLAVSHDILFTNASKGVYLGVTSATASNLLDDYEEGTWTPSFSDLSNTPTYHILTGRYTKVGRQVMVQLSMQSNAAPTFNDNSNVLAITGLPFAIDSVGYVSGVGAVSKQSLSYNGSNNNSNVTGEIVAVANTSEQINFQVSTSGGLRGNVKNVGATGGFIIELTLFYTGS